MTGMTGHLRFDADWVAWIISGAAVVIAGTSLYVAVMTYRRAGAKLRVSSPGQVRRRFAVFRIHQGIWLNAVVRNAGLAPLQVESVRWHIDAEELPMHVRLSRGRHRHPEQDPFNADGTDADLVDPFPVTIPGQHAFHWLTTTPDWDVDQTGRSAYRMRLVVRLGTGKVVRSRWVIINKGVDWPLVKKLAWPRRLA